jgi:Na+/H+-dicarboxylate symporter
MKNKLKNAGIGAQTSVVLMAMLGGIALGLLIKFVPIFPEIKIFIIDNILDVVGNIFITLMKMLIVPLVMISLTCGISSLGDIKQFRTLGIRSLAWFVGTTALAVASGVFVAALFDLGIGAHFSVQSAVPEQVASFRQFFLDIIPGNPIHAMADGNMLQLIVFTILFGLAINLAGNRGKSIAGWFQDLNIVIMKLVDICIKFTPYGVFCLMAVLFAKFGGQVILSMLNYVLTVLLVLLVYTLVVYTSLLKIVGKLSPLVFFRKMYSTMLFAFSVSSSNVSIPIMLETVEYKLGVNNAVASFVIPLGVNINKNGTAIMQGVAAVFIAHAYQVNLGLVGYLTIILVSTLATIGTAGAVSSGVFTLAVVLKQIGVPIEGIALILGVDRVVDMFRTVVNVVSNTAIACLVSKSTGQLDVKVYRELINSR